MNQSAYVKASADTASPYGFAWLRHAKPKAKRGGHDWDRTSDPYDVNVVLSR